VEKKEKRIILGIVYTKFFDDKGPVPILSHKPDTNGEVDYNLQMSISVKCITMLTGEERKIPLSLSIIPFPSQNIKTLAKYLEWKDDNYRGGFGLGVISVLFNEADDVIFYKYIQHFETILDKYSQRFAEFELSKTAEEIIIDSIKALSNEMEHVLEDLRSAELSTQKAAEFPETFKKGGKGSEYVFKILVCGDPEVGKTSTVLRFTDNAFKRTYISTIGVNIVEKSFLFENALVQFVIWDIAGQSKFETTRRHFYQGIEGVLLVFDLTTQESLDNISKWYQDLMNNADNTETLIGSILGNKNDLTDKIVIRKEDAEKLANELNLEYFETSALTGENVESAFHKLAEDLLKSRI